MTSPAPFLTVAIDTTADVAGVALFDGDLMLSELTWYSRQSHSRDLLPALEWLLQRSGRKRTDVQGISVCLGPGSYAGMRVGISTAKALAYGLGAALVGIGRLEADALSFVGAAAGRVVPLHAAGRAEIAWAGYEADGAGLREVASPRLTPLEGLPDVIESTDIVCGDVSSLPPALVDLLAAQGTRVASPPVSRVIAVGRLGLLRLAAGERDDPRSLAPMYLRAPAIGPQPPIA